MCEASPDRKMDDELNHPSNTSDEVIISLRESTSDTSESGDGARLAAATIDGSDDDNDKTSISPSKTDLYDPCISDTASSSRSGDDDPLSGPTTVPLETTLTSSSREEESGSMITSDADISKCNSTAPLIGCAASSVTSVDERNNDREFPEESNDNDELIPPPSTVKSMPMMETEDKLLSTIAGPSPADTEKYVGQHSELQNNNPTVVERPAVAAYMKGKVLEDNGKLNERLKKRWEKRNQERRTTTKTTNQDVQSVATFSRNDHSSSRHQQSSGKSDNSTVASDNSDILSRFGGKGSTTTTTTHIYPDVVSFGEEDEEGVASIHVVSDSSFPTRTTKPTYRKCFSEIGPNTCSSSKSPRRIGILQADGIVYDDALLLRLARQSRSGQHRRRGSATIKGDTADPITGEEFPVFQTNAVKIHVYDLLTQDALVEMPYLNCNFPIGRCFKAVNDSCNYFGTGAYHVGVEVNGVEYAYGGNNIRGMSGIFTCVPKESPGYDYRDTIDFGKLHTTKRTWIRIPKASASNQRMSAALVRLTEESNDNDDDENDASEASQHEYSFREIETFADGHTVIHEMAIEYMGADYDLLRKNCCTFANDVCLRLEVKEDDIPSWFRNAAQAGAQAEDTLTNVDNTVKNVFSCNEGTMPQEEEECSAGFEVVAKMGGGEGSNTPTWIKVVETSPERRSRSTFLGIPIDLLENEIAMRETASWA